jgi:hypothetical protein
VLGVPIAAVLPYLLVVPVREPLLLAGTEQSCLFDVAPFTGTCHFLYFLLAKRHPVLAAKGERRGLWGETKNAPAPRGRGSVRAIVRRSANLSAPSGGASGRGTRPGLGS